MCFCEAVGVQLCFCLKRASLVFLFADARLHSAAQQKEFNNTGMGSAAIE